MIEFELLKRIIEAAILASGNPLTPAQLLGLFENPEAVSHEEIARALESLQADSANRGIELVEVASGFRYQVRHDVPGPAGQNGATLRKLLAGEDLIAQGVQPVLIEHPRTKELIEAVPTAEAEALLITRGLLRQSKKAESVEREIQQLKDSMERSVFRQARKTMWQTLVKAVHASSVPVTPSADLVRAWLVAQCDHLQDDDLVAAFDLPDIEGGDRIEDRARMAAQRIPSVGLWKAVVILMMAEDQAPGFHLANSKTKEDPPHFTAVANMLGVDLKPIEAEARATIKAQTAEEIKALKAQIAPKPKAAPTPAADVDVSTGGKGAKVKKADAPLRKPKTSAAEAQASIAAAMQAEDQKTEPGADAQGIEATASGFALAVGARMWTPWACALQHLAAAKRDAAPGACPVPDHRRAPGAGGWILQGMPQAHRRRAGSVCRRGQCRHLHRPRLPPGQRASPPRPAPRRRTTPPTSPAR